MYQPSDDEVLELGMSLMGCALIARDVLQMAEEPASRTPY